MVNGFIDKYKIYVIDNAEIPVDSDIEQIICKNPHINRVLMGNYKPDFVRDDAVCTWINEGHRFYNEFLT